jgi:hypothetical protein
MVQTVEADCELTFSDVNLALAKGIQLLEPYGVSNPIPGFVLRGVTVNDITGISEGKHSRISLGNGKYSISGMYFSNSPDSLGIFVGDKVDVLFNLDVNEWGGRESVQLIVRDIRVSNAQLDEWELERARFEEIKSGERFVLNINHLRSKRGTGDASNSKRMVNVDSLLVMLDRIEKEQLFGDKDILLVGDYNCYSQEQPIQTLVQAGYEDVLMQYDSTGYSYVYHSEAGYLDRAFASPTMAAQVKAVHPYHLNADYFYSRGYKRRLDKTMFRYADHDPILISIQLGDK